MQSQDFTPGWEPVHVGFEGAAFVIGGIHPWAHAARWQSVSPEPIVVPHPAHRHERHRAWIYDIVLEKKSVRFAAAELSNGVWGFYVPHHAAT